MTSITAVGMAFNDVDGFIGIYTARAVSGLDTVLADLTLPTGSLAAAKAIGTYGTAYELSDGRVVRDADPIEFRPASSAEAVSIRGWYYANAATGGALQGYQDLPAIISLPDETFAWTILFRLTVQPSALWEAVITFNG